jgi:hypothetical protein
MFSLYPKEFIQRGSIPGHILPSLGKGQANCLVCEGWEGEEDAPQMN